MDIDLNETVNELVDNKKDKLNSWIAITVALFATFMGLCKVKDDNIVQAMQQAQADKIDHWAWYQSLHVREEVINDRLDALTLQQALANDADKQAITRSISETKAKLAHLTEHKEQMQNEAKADQEKYDALNYHDDQFDLSDAMMALAISLLAITALVHKRWLYFVALLPASIGILMGLSGFFGWHIHSDLLANLLS